MLSLSRCCGTSNTRFETLRSCAHELAIELATQPAAANQCTASPSAAFTLGTSKKQVGLSCVQGGGVSIGCPPSASPKLSSDHLRSFLPLRIHDCPVTVSTRIAVASP